MLNCGSERDPPKNMGSAKHVNWEFSTVAEGPSDRLSTEAALISKVTPGACGRCCSVRSYVYLLLLIACCDGATWRSLRQISRPYPRDSMEHLRASHWLEVGCIGQR